MSYTKQNFSSKSVLYASQLNAMDNQIATNENNFISCENRISSLSSLMTQYEFKSNCRAYLVKLKGSDLEFHVDNLLAGDYVLHYVRRCVKNCAYDWTPLSELDAYQFWKDGELPDYMSNGGYMPEDLTFSIAQSGSNYVTRWRSDQVFTNMVKAQEKSVNDSNLFLMGVPKTRPYKSIPISFYVARKESDGSETVVARSENIAYVSGCQSFPKMYIRDNRLVGLRISIK